MMRDQFLDRERAGNAYQVLERLRYEIVDELQAIIFRSGKIVMRSDEIEALSARRRVLEERLEALDVSADVLLKF